MLSSLAKRHLIRLVSCVGGVGGGDVGCKLRVSLCLSVVVGLVGVGVQLRLVLSSMDVLCSSRHAL